jgi:hypothetical protein
VRNIICLTVAACAFGLAACQGNVGNGGIGIPGAAVPPGTSNGNQATQTRERTLEGAVYVGPEMSDLPLPSVGGFAVKIVLGATPPSATPSPSPSAAGGRSGSRGRKTAGARAAASPAPSASASPSPSAGASGSPGPQGKPSPKASGSPLPPKITTKTTVYPESAPEEPTPDPTGSVETFLKRDPLVRGYLQSQVTVPLYGLGAVRFTIPVEEQTEGRGFTVALFESQKKHRQHLVAFDASAVLQDDVISSSLTSPALTLKKGVGYILVLYADELAATPGPAQTYPPPGNNPFPSPSPSGHYFGPPTNPPFGSPPNGFGQPTPYHP